MARAFASIFCYNVAMSLFPPYEPEVTARQQKRRRFRRVPIRYLVPNVITLLALCSGMTAIRMALEGRYEWAVACIMIAIVFDGLDGRIARLMKGTTKFGAELDSLADFVNFGVAPAVVMYLWALQEFKALGWVVALSLALCAALRLARFNVALDDPDKPAWMGNYFTGVPAPAGAMLALLPLYLGLLGEIDGASLKIPVLLYVPAVAFLMVSQVPTFSGKLIGQRVRRDMVLPILIVAVMFTVLLVSFPWIMLSSVCVGYLAFIPLSVFRFGKLSARTATSKPAVDSQKSEEKAPDEHQPS